MKRGAEKTGLTGIEGRWKVVRALRTLEATLLPRNTDPAVEAILGQIEQARNQVAQGQDQAASTLVTQIQTAVGSLAAPAHPAPRLALAGTQAATARLVAASPAKPGAAPQPGFCVRRRSRLTGISGS